MSEPVAVPFVDFRTHVQAMRGEIDAAVAQIGTLAGPGPARRARVSLRTV